MLVSDKSEECNDCESNVYRHRCPCWDCGAGGALVAVSPRIAVCERDCQRSCARSRRKRAAEVAPTAAVSAPPAAIEQNETAIQPTAAALNKNETAIQPAAGESLADAAPTAIAVQGITWSGTFQSLAHETKGTADVRMLEDGSRVLRLEGFTTSNGPDVRIYLVRGSDGTQDDAIKRGDFIDLGALKGNIGDQNYAISADVDLSEYQSVSIWCRRFSVNFGATMLN